VSVKYNFWSSVSASGMRFGKFQLSLILCGCVIFSPGSFGQVPGVTEAAELYVDFEYEKALAILTPLVENGDRPAKKLTAFIFSDPFSEYYDPDRARSIFDEMVAYGDMDAALMLLDESYWNDGVDMQQARANLSGKTIELLLAAAENGYHPAYYRMMLACRFESFKCGDFMNWPRPDFNREFIHMSRILRFTGMFDELIAENNFDVFDDPPIVDLDDISAMLAAPDSYQGSLLWDGIDVARISHPYLASIVLVLGAGSLQDSDCKKSLVSTAYAIAIVEQNDFWHIVKNFSKDDSFFQDLKRCALKFSQEKRLDFNDYELLLRLVEPLMPVYNSREGMQWQGIAESRTTYTKWCFANAKQGSFFRCQFQSFLDHYFRCNALALDGFLDSLEVNSHRTVNNGAGRRYHQCRAYYHQES
jgi:hypothetical protein